MIGRRDFVTGVLVGAAGMGLAGGAGVAAWRHGVDAQARGDASLSYAQMGEDLVLDKLLRDAMRIERPTYLDIGAADPIVASNTYLQYLRGGHGVLVEPNPAYQAPLHRHRPHDVIVNAGVGVDDATEADYYVIRDAPMRNTFSKDDVEFLRKRSGQDVVERVLKMRLIAINRLIAEYCGGTPDLLSTDVEGLDFAILQTLDFDKYRPAVVIAESQPNGPIPALLAAKGYEMRGASMYNLIFADPKRYVRA